jgi:hypothetical protein
MGQTQSDQTQTWRLTIANLVGVPVEVTLNGTLIQIPGGKAAERRYAHNTRVMLVAKPTQQYAGMFQASNLSGQDMMRDISLNVAVINDAQGGSKLGFS